MIDFVICLGWGIACSYYLLLVKSAPSQLPDLLNWLRFPDG